MKKLKLDPIEKNILQDIEDDNWLSVENVSDEITRVQQMIARQNKKDQRMSIRISGADLDRIKAIALEEGLPYQTLITSILHKYVRGKLKEV